MLTLWRSQCFSDSHWFDWLVLYCARAARSYVSPIAVTSCWFALASCIRRRHEGFFSHCYRWRCASHCVINKFIKELSNWGELGFRKIPRNIAPWCQRSVINVVGQTKTHSTASKQTYCKYTLIVSSIISQRHHINGSLRIGILYTVLRQGLILQAKRQSVRTHNDRTIP